MIAAVFLTAMISVACSSTTNGDHKGKRGRSPIRVITNLPNPDNEVITSVNATIAASASWSASITGLCSAQGSATITWNTKDQDATYNATTGLWEVGGETPATSAFSSNGDFSSCLFAFPSSTQTGTIALQMSIGRPTVVSGTVSTLDTIGQSWDKLCSIGPNDIFTSCSRSNPMAFVWTVPDLASEAGEADCPPLKPGPTTTQTSVVGTPGVTIQPIQSNGLIPTKPCTFKAGDTYSGTGSLSSWPSLNAAGAMTTSWTGSGSIDVSLDTSSTIIGNLPVVVPRSVDFATVNPLGPVKVGQFRPATVALDNEPSATKTLEVASVEITGPDASQFRIAGGNCVGAVLHGGDPACTESVWLKPGRAGTFHATLVIHDNSRAGKESIPLTGAGA